MNLNNFSINPRLVLSAGTIALSTALLIGATFAFFSDTANSIGQVLAAGTLDLKLSDVDENSLDNVSQSLNFSNLAPGQSSTSFIKLQNTGSMPIAEVKLGANQTSNVNGGDS